MKVKSKALGVIVISIIIGGVFTASAFNIWNTKSNKSPNTYREGQFQGKYDPADIRGSYSFGDIEKSFGIPMEVLAKAFGVEGEENLSSFQAKNLESIYSGLIDEGKEIGTGSVKIFVALYSGLPIDLSGDDYIPKPAVDILFQKGSLTNEQVSYLKSHIVDIK